MIISWYGLFFNFINIIVILVIIEKALSYFSQYKRKERSLVQIIFSSSLHTIFLGTFIFFTKINRKEKKNSDLINRFKERINIQQSTVPLSHDIEIRNKDIVLSFSSKHAQLVEIKLLHYKKKNGEKIQIKQREQEWFKLHMPEKRSSLFDGKFEFHSIEENATDKKIFFVHWLDKIQKKGVWISYILPHSGTTFDFHTDFSALEIENICFTMAHSFPSFEGKSSIHENDVSFSYQNKNKKTVTLPLYKASKKPKNIQDANGLSMQQRFFKFGLSFPKNNAKNIIFLLEKKSSKKEGLGRIFIQGELLLDKEKKLQISFYLGPRIRNKYLTTLVPFARDYPQCSPLFYPVTKTFYYIINRTHKRGINPLLVLLLLFLFLMILQIPATYLELCTKIKRKLLAPEVKKIKEKFATDKEKIMIEESKLYNNYGLSFSKKSIFFRLIQGYFVLPLRLFLYYEIYFRNVTFLNLFDISSYGKVISLPFYLPWIGSHITIIAIFTSIFIIGSMMYNIDISGDNFFFLIGIKFFVFYIGLLFFNIRPITWNLYCILSRLFEIILSYFLKMIISESDLQDSLRKKPPSPASFKKPRKLARMEEREKNKKG